MRRFWVVLAVAYFLLGAAVTVCIGEEWLVVDTFQEAALWPCVTAISMGLGFVCLFIYCRTQKGKTK